jgi:hypothetical protein
VEADDDEEEDGTYAVLFVTNIDHLYGWKHVTHFVLCLLLRQTSKRWQLPTQCNCVQSYFSMLVTVNKLLIRSCS